jgi:hypothetical protein
MDSLLIKFELGPGPGPGSFPLKSAMSARRSPGNSTRPRRPLCSPSLSSHTESVRQAVAEAEAEAEARPGGAHPRDSSRSFRSEPGLGFRSLPSSAPAMSGREVRDYTNLSDPKSVWFFHVHQFVELLARSHPYPLPFLYEIY